MLAILGVKGWQVVDEPNRAEAIVVNTCAFIDESKEESVDAILEMAEYKDHGRCKALVVSGCLAQRYADQLAEEMPEVDYFLGTANTPKYPKALNGREICLGALSQIPILKRLSGPRGTRCLGTRHT